MHPMYWYYTVRGDGEKHGIAGEMVLFEMAKKGKLRPTDFVWNASDGTKWVPASTIEGLFPKGLGPAANTASESCVEAVESVHGRFRRVMSLVSGLTILCAVGIVIVLAVRNKVEELAAREQRPPERETGPSWLDDPILTQGINTIAASTRSNEVTILLRKAAACLNAERIDEADALLKQLEQYEGGAEYVRAIAGRLDPLRRSVARRKELEKALREGTLTAAEAEDLLHIYRDRKEERTLATSAENMLRDKNSLTAGTSLAIARLCGEAGWVSVQKVALREFVTRSGMIGHADGYLEAAKMYRGLGEPLEGAELLDSYLVKTPGSVVAWLELAAIRSEAGDSKEAFRALREAVRQGGEEACAVARRDERFNSIRGTSAFRRLVGAK